MNDVILKRTDLSWPEKLGALAVLFKEKGEVLCPVSHRFEPGLYIREMFIPQGTYFIGRAHRHGHKVTLDAGHVRLILENGAGTHSVELEAPHELTTAPYFQMVFEALTDVWGSTYHPRDDEAWDIKQLEEEAFLPVDDVLAIGRNVLARLEVT